MRTKFSAILIFLALLSAGHHAHAQTQPAVRQQGSITTNHVATWCGNNCVKDGGSPSGTGTVTSVAATGDGGAAGLFSSTISGSAITSAGTLGIGASILTHGPAQFFATSATTTGSPGFRPIATTDLPIATNAALGVSFFPAAGGLSVTSTGGVQIQAPGISQLGGLLATTSSANEFEVYIDATGTQHLAQPAFSNLSGTAQVAQGGTGLSSLGTPNTCLGVNGGGTALTYLACTITGGATTAAFSGLTAATGNNTIDNAAFTQAWKWNSATTADALDISTSTLSTAKLLSLVVTTSGNSGDAAYFQNTATGTTGYAIDVAGAARVTGNITISGTANAVGTITSGTWNGDIIDIAHGGTSVNSFVFNGILAGGPGGTSLEQTNVLANAVVITDASSNPIESVSLPAQVQQGITKLGSVTTGSFNLSGNNILSGTTTVGNLNITGVCNGCKGLIAGTQLVVNPYDISTHNIAHGLTGIPAVIDVRLVNLTSNMGYSPGQIVVIGGSNVNGANAAFAVSADGTNIYFSGAASPSITQFNSASSGTITNADWELVVTPYMIR